MADGSYKNSLRRNDNGSGSLVAVGHRYRVLSTVGCVAFIRPMPAGARVDFRIRGTMVPDDPLELKDADDPFDDFHSIGPPVHSLASMLWPRTVDGYCIILPYWLIGLVAYTGLAACWPRLCPSLGRRGIPRLSLSQLLLITGGFSVILAVYATAGELSAVLVGEAILLFTMGYRLGQTSSVETKN